MTSVEVRGLSFGYDVEPVLRDVDVCTPDGTLLAVVGSSGCGKTTLLRVLAGFERPWAGEVRLGGEVVVGPGVDVALHRRRVGIVPQEGALFPHLSVADNVGFALARRDPGRAARVAELLVLAGLQGLGDRYPRELFGGQQQRVALARALAPRPRVVLLDEPFAALDPATRRGVRVAVREVLAEEGATAVLVTHDREEALSMADRVAVLDAGRVLQVGGPTEVYDAPVDAVVAALLGEVNLLPVDAPLVLSGGAGHGSGGGRAVVRPEQVAVAPDGGQGGGRA